MKPLTIIDGTDEEGKNTFLSSFVSREDLVVGIGDVTEPSKLIQSLTARSEVRMVGYWHRLPPEQRRVMDRLALAKNAVIATFTESHWLLTRDIPSVSICDYRHEDKEKVKRLIASRRGPDNSGPGVGRFAPDSILLVGERPNLRSGDTYLGSFCSWRSNSSSCWLSQQLEKANIPESSLYWVNAYDQYGRVTSAKFLKDMKPRAVIALGRHADTWCYEVAQITHHVQCPHPEFWKRFGSKEPYQLIDILRSYVYGPYTKAARFN